MIQTPLRLQLRLNDPAYDQRLASFLGSLGKQALVSARGQVDVGDEIDELELAIYLRVWNVLYPEAHVALEPSP